MTSFLFIPAAVDRVVARRVDFGNIAALFAESEEPERRGAVWREVFRLGAALALALLAIGDTFVVTHSAALGGAPLPPAASLRSIS